MDERHFYFVAVMLITVHTAFSQTETCMPDTSSVGTRFMIGVPFSYTNPNQIQLIMTTADDDAHVRVAAPLINVDAHYIFSKHFTVSLNVAITHLKNDTQWKGIEVESDKPISVVVMVGTGDFLEGYLALPVTPLSTEFVVASYKPRIDSYHHDFSIIMVVGIYRDTFVDIQLPDSYRTSGPSRIELQPFETFNFQGLQDLSGTVIKSSRPVSVISGSSQSNIPAGTGDSQYIVEQMVPTALWGFTYIVPPIYPRSQHLIRIFAKESNTEVIYNGTLHVKRYIDQFDYKDFIEDQRPVFIFADKPISVVQYGYDTDNLAGDPYMANAQAVEQQLSRYEFTTQDYYNGNQVNTLAVSIKAADISGLVLNGKKTDIAAAPKFTFDDPVENYTVVFLDVASASYHVIEHERNQKFGAVLYGLSGTGYAYGYPLELYFRDTTCTPNITGSTGNAQKALAQCFTCDDMTSLKYCDKVSTCNNVNEMCYVQKYQKSAGVERFRSGCRNERTCNTTLPGECVYCCEGNFCNMYGCGDDGVQSMQNRGPLCFDCAHHGEHEACETIQLCSSGEVCKVERYRWGDIDMHYVKGCADTRTCSSRRRAIHGNHDDRSLGTRSVPVCSSCCTKDFCNQNCTRSGVGAGTIIG